MKATPRLLQVAATAILLMILGTISYIVYVFERSFGFAIIALGLMLCIGMVFGPPSRMLTGEKTSLHFKLAFFCSGSILVIIGVLLMLRGL